ncbi:hypothetical protein WA026_004558 [Henosepilachna vigintioctopunctata]|uniref:Uncharacterized protein n=1 Tax=Henosepilachna vigintioctopunctata TaxID=420089 RepID=A0AAW1V1Z0_9CUCU
MNTDSGGTPLSPLLLSQFTPKSQRTCDIIFNSDVENSQFSPADFYLLSKEVEAVIRDHVTDEELHIEAKNLSQTLDSIIQKNSKSRNHNNLDSQSNSNTNNSNLVSKKPKSNLRYSNNDSGPFLVIVESISDKNVGNIHPMDLGKKLFNNNITNIKCISKKGKKRIGIEFHSAQAANSFTDSDFLNKN